MSTEAKPLQLQYASPETNRRTFRELRRETIALLVGLTTMLLLWGISQRPSVKNSPTVIIIALATFGIVGAAGIVIVWVAEFRRRIIPDYIASRLAGPLVAVLFFPMAHFVACRLIRFNDYGEVFASDHSPLLFALPWLAASAGITRLCWSEQFVIGTHLWHWWLAGTMLLIIPIGEMLGVQYLRFSINRSMLGSISGEFAISASSVGVLPLLIALTFSPISRSGNK